ncbi:hypothetical protein MSEDJ_14820 [Mycolicibacterium sediminis]|uniref:DUF222 domain-containing protein n=1 Tax=Mycolicibacterium sediminis TaxID=1286180 RepID=A0A7I7QNJ9_9MYCO|nr:hypothetical protein MSEDJ_14820 [Mycolicibacterium sediminis]
MQAEAAWEAVGRLRADYEAFAALPIDLLTRSQVLAVWDEFEAMACQMPTQRHRLLARLQAETTPQGMGAKSWNEVLRLRWRVSAAEASRRLAEAADLAPRTGLTGEPLAPLLPAVAAAQAVGAITAEHVKILRDAMSRMPAWVDTPTRDQIEVDLVRIAVTVGPKDLKDAAEMRLFLLDQDGPEPDDTEPQQSRGVEIGPQGPDGTRTMSGQLSPEAAAVLEPLMAKYAAPGMCNPADPDPCTSGTPSQAQIDGDHRTRAQRQHDALIVIGRIALMSGDLGRLNGLPVSVIIRTTLQDLESSAGVGVTGGGTTVPIKDVVRMGAHAHHYLAVFDKASGSALELFRARRVASPAQRIMLIARDGGCTKPGCPVGAYGCQVHHAVTDWAQGGNTNVDEMALACGADNRLVGEGGWTTTITDRGDVEWQPPPDLDNGHTPINYHHRPELLLRPPHDDTGDGGAADDGDAPRRRSASLRQPPGAEDSEPQEPAPAEIPAEEGLDPRPQGSPGAAPSEPGPAEAHAEEGLEQPLPEPQGSPEPQPTPMQPDHEPGTPTPATTSDHLAALTLAFMATPVGTQPFPARADSTDPDPPHHTRLRDAGWTLLRIHPHADGRGPPDTAAA